MDPLLIVFGLGVGLLVGLTGIGGGSLMTPILILVFGIKPVTAVGTDLAYGAITKTVGGWKHLRQKTVNLGLSGWMAVGSVPAAILGVYVLELIQKAVGEDFDDVLLTIVGSAVLFVGAVVLFRALFLKKMIARERDSFPLAVRHKWAAVAVGAFIGFFVGVSSAGSGALIALVLILMFRLSPTRVVGTDVFHAAILLWAAAAAHIVSGNVDFAVAGTILIGSVPGVWIGSHMSIRVPIASLRTGLAIVLIGAGLGLLTKAGVPIPVPVLAGAPLLLAAVVGWAVVKRRVGLSAIPLPVER